MRRTAKEAAASGIFGLLLGSFWAWGPSAWYDEAATMSAVDRSYGDVVELVGGVDAVHGLYYLVAKVWSSLTWESLSSLRLLSATGLGVAAALAVLLMRRLTAGPAAPLAGPAVVLLPGVSWAAVEARSYAWTAALALLSTYLLVLARERHSIQLWTAYTAAMIASIWLFLFTAPLMVAHGVALHLADRRVPRPWWGSTGITCLATTPLVVIGYQQRDQIEHIDLSVGEVVVRVLGAQAFTGPGFRSEERSAWIAAGAVTAVLVTFAAGSALVRRDRLPDPERLLQPLLWTWAIAPTLVIVVPHLWGSQTYQIRYLTYAMPPVALLAVLGIASFEGVRRWGLAAAIAAAALAVVVPSHLPDAKSREDYRGLAALADRWEPDAVVFSGAGSRGLRIVYREPFEGTVDLILQRSPSASGTLFGTNRRPRLVRRHEVRDRVLLHYQRSTMAPDAYASRLQALGCRPVAQHDGWRFSATLLDC